MHHAFKLKIVVPNGLKDRPVPEPSEGAVCHNLTLMESRNVHIRHVVDVVGQAVGILRRARAGRFWRGSRNVGFRVLPATGSARPRSERHVVSARCKTLWGPSLVYRGRRLQLNQAWPAYLPLLWEWAGRFTEGALLYPESRMPKGDALPPTMD